MNKPTDPNISIPAEFASNGTKVDFPDPKILNGFDPINPDVLPGDCLNKFIDDTYKGLNYAMAGTDAINLIQEGEVLTVKDGELVSGSISGLPIGTIYPVVCTADYVPTGGLPTDGTEYTKSQFPNLWENYLNANTPLLNTCTYAEYANDILTYGQCGKFAIDEVNEIFKVPTIKDGSYITQANSDNELGKSYNESLPNITGYFGTYSSNGRLISNGAFRVDKGGMQKNTATSGNLDGYASYDFNASRSSSTYQDNAPVQGNNVRLRYFVQVATGQINPSDMDWAAWASSLQSKLNKDVSTNISNTGKSYVAGLGMPSDTYVNLTLGASGTVYTAPANGYYVIDKMGDTGQYLDLEVYDANIENLLYVESLISSATDTNLRIIIPIFKNNVLKIWYSASGNTVRFRFIYAVGSESEAS